MRLIHRFSTCLLAFLLLFNCIPSAFATEFINSEEVYVGIYTAPVELETESEEIQEEFAEPVKNYTSIYHPNGATMTSEDFRIMFDLPDDGTSYTFYPELVSVEEFLDMFVRKNGGKYIQKRDSMFYYPAENTLWMSEEDWYNLTKNLLAPITKETGEAILKRTEECNELIKSHWIPDTYERYKDLINAFYPEFSDLVENNKAAVTYWVKQSVSDDVYNRLDMSSILHETIHEKSAKLSNVFQSREVKDGYWQVNWSKKPSSMYLRNPKTGEFAETAMNSTVQTRNLLKTIPTTVKKSEQYKIYTKSSAASCQYGIYGMMQELCSCAADIKFYVASAGLGSYYDYVNDSMLQNWYWWKGSICTYMENLEKKNPNAFDKLMNDETLIEVMRDTFEYVEETLENVEISPSKEETKATMRDWANSIELPEWLQMD